MRCEKAKGLLPDLLAGEIGIGERVLLRAHLLRCRKCRKEAEELRQVIRALDSLKVREGPAVELPEGETSRRPFPWRLAPAALAVALLVLWLLLPMGRQTEEPPELIAWEMEELVWAMPEEDWEYFLATSFGGGEWEEAFIGLLEDYVGEIPYG